MPLNQQFVVTDAQRIMMYIFPSREERDLMEIELKKRFPLITFYRGISNRFGMVEFEKPKFPEGKK